MPTNSVDGQDAANCSSTCPVGRGGQPSDQKLVCYVGALIALRINVSVSSLDVAPPYRFD